MRDLMESTSSVLTSGEAITAAFATVASFPELEIETTSENPFLEYALSYNVYRKKNQKLYTTL